MEMQRNQNSQNNYEEEQSCRLTLPYFKNYKATVIKTVWYWWEVGQRDQQNRMENPKTNPHIYSQLIFDKDSKAM